MIVNERRSHDNRTEPSQLHLCLNPLLKWLEWDGSERDLLESLPHLRTIDSVGDFRWTMQNLGYKSEIIFVSLDHLDQRLLPCLFIPDKNEPPQVLIEYVGQGLSVFNSENAKVEIVTVQDTKGYVVVFKKTGDETIKIDPTHWFKDALLSRKKLLYYVAFLSFLQALLTLAPSIFIISVYDKVVTSASIAMLITFSVGVMAALASLAIIMMIRFRIMGFIGAYIQRYIGNIIFQQLLKLPPIYTESAPVGTQIARLNDFNSVRDFFSNPLFGTVIEIPFLLIYIVAVWIIGGLLVLVPLLCILASMLIAYIMWQRSRRDIRESSIIHAKQQDFLVESLWGMRALQYAGLQNIWKKRFRDVNSESSLHSRNIQLSSSISDATSDLMMTLSGLATLIIGTVMVIDNSIQIGALIGVMFIIWRILAPVKTVNVMLPKLIQLNQSINQINELMRIPTEEKASEHKKSATDRIVGALTFSQVTFRYAGSETSALIDVNFSLKPGQMLSVLGPSGAGKSTLTNLILAMYLPQAGRIYIDGRNIKQYDPFVLRTTLAYVPQKAELFYGTIAQNLMLADPIATTEQLIVAAKAANILKEIEAMPAGFNTRIKDYGDKALGESFCQKLSLARAYLRDAPIIIMDEPVTALDAESAESILNFLQNVKGKKTIVLITNVREQILMADLALVLFDGKQMMLDQPDKAWEYAQSIHLV